LHFCVISFITQQKNFQANKISTGTWNNDQCAANKTHDVMCEVEIGESFFHYFLINKLQKLTEGIYSLYYKHINDHHDCHDDHRSDAFI